MLFLAMFAIYRFALFIFVAEVSKATVLAGEIIKKNVRQSQSAYSGTVKTDELNLVSVLKTSGTRQ